MKNIILITGVAGFIGSKIAHRFLEEGYKVIGVDNLSGGNIDNIPDGVDFIKGDLDTKNTFKYIPSDCNTILHLAGQSSGEVSFDDPVLDLQKNTISTLNLIEYGIENSIDCLLYASSMSVYGSVKDQPVKEKDVNQPLSCYGVGKLASEGYLKVYQKQLPSISLRMFNVYGPGQDMNNLRQGMVSIYLAQALKNKKIEVKGSLDRFRDFIFIDDVVETWFRLSNDPKALGKTLNLATGTRTKVYDLLEKICDAVPGCQYFVNGITSGDQDGIYADILELKRNINTDLFTPLDVGLEKFIKWAKKTRIN